MMRHYLDHAATTWPKPPGVIEAAIKYQTECGAPASRGFYKSALEASNIVLETRRAIRGLLNAASLEEIAFCSNGTHALNEAIFGLAQGLQARPFHVLTSAIEHNSVLRPLALAATRGQLEWNAVECDALGYVDPEDVARAIRPNTKAFILSHVSNVTGAVQRIEEISHLVRSRGIIFIVDASQSAGYLPIDVQSMGIDILASAGHKGLCGMLGTGLLYARSDLQPHLAPVMIGGTGESSDRIDGDFSWQSRVESGNQNVAAIASLLAGLVWKKNAPQPALAEWNGSILEAIKECENLQLIGSDSTCLSDRLPVFSLIPSGNSGLVQTPQEMAMFLDSASGIECRAGFHCAGMIHDSIKTREYGGTLRLSLGCTSTEADVIQACEGLFMLNQMLSS